MKKRLLATGLVAALAWIGLPSVAQAAQTVTVDLSGSCEDGVMDEAEDDDDCVMTVTFKPSTPARVVTFNYLKGKKWTRLKSVTTKGGVAKWDVSAYDADDMWLDGTYSYRAQSVKKGKEKAYTSKTITIKYIADVSGEDEEEESAISGGNKTTNTTTKTTNPTSKNTQATTPSSGGAGHTPTAPNATTPTAPSPHGAPTPSTAVTTPTMHSPTMSTSPSSSSSFYSPVRSTSEINNSSLCANNGGPVSTTICEAVKTSKSTSQLTSVLAGISSIYTRDNFCRWIFGFMDKGVSFDEAGNKCAQVGAKSN